MIFSPEQDAALKAVSDWLADKRAKQTFYLAGYAGTGKTTLAKHFAESVRSVCFAAFTGKAALVLRGKGCEGASTIHSLIYKPKKTGTAQPEFTLDYDSQIKKADLVVIDEVSMVDMKLGTDLLSFGKRILVLGDPAQLSPVKGEGFFTSGDPDFMLTEVHRQAADNPIIAMSMDIREGRGLKLGSYGTSKVIRRDGVNAPLVLKADQVLVGRNKTRRMYNARIRELKGFQGFFQKGDRVVCLKNDATKGLLNGGIWQVRKVRAQSETETEMMIKPLDAGVANYPIDVFTHHHWLTGREQELHWKIQRQYQPFDFAYALTCHKSQGSQWDDVLVFNEGDIFPEPARWLYTAVTRAAEKVTVVL